MSDRDAARVNHMLEAARKASQIISGKTQDELASDEVSTLATLRLLEILGEAAKAISDDVRQRNPDILWREIARTRDRLIHAYFDVDLDIVWNILTVDLPPLITSLEILKRNEGF
jgi:uncharacterized protein with HEPN domain